jgi:hypothetical protein
VTGLCLPQYDFRPVILARSHPRLANLFICFMVYLTTLKCIDYRTSTRNMIVNDNEACWKKTSWCVSSMSLHSPWGTNKYHKHQQHSRDWNTQPSECEGVLTAHHSFRYWVDLSGPVKIKLIITPQFMRQYVFSWWNKFNIGTQCRPVCSCVFGRNFIGYPREYDISSYFPVS